MDQNSQQSQSQQQDSIQPMEQSQTLPQPTQHAVEQTQPQTPAPMAQPTPSTPPSPPRTPEQVLPHEHHFSLHKLLLVVLIILVILFGTAYIGTFYLLNKQLDKLTHGGQSPKQSAKQLSAIPSPSPLPTTSPTQNLKKYTSPNGFSFSYPESGKVIEKEGILVVQLNSGGQYFVFATITSQQEPFEKPTLQITPSLPRAPETVTEVTEQTETINGKEFQIFTVSCNATDCTHVEAYFSSNTTYYKILFNKVNGELATIMQNMLSTFSFTDAQLTLTPNVSQIACTQEAKLCPDNKTYVSRQGPNCEFLACP